MSEDVLRNLRQAIVCDSDAKIQTPLWRVVSPVHYCWKFQILSNNCEAFFHAKGVKYAEIQM